MTTSGDLAHAFTALRDILRAHAADMLVQEDTPTEFTLVTRAVLHNKLPMWFGCVRRGKGAVSYHLMPLYANPKLKAAMPAALKPRLRGKACFNFKRPAPALFAMVDELTRQGREHFEKHGFLEPGPLSQEQIEAAARGGGADVDGMNRRREQVAARRRAKPRTGVGASRGGSRQKPGTRKRSR